MTSMHRMAVVLLLCFSGLATTSRAVAQTPPAPTSTEESSVADAAGPFWWGSEGHRLPFETHEEVGEFLRHGQVISEEVLETGSTRPLKVRLEHRGVEAHAIFRQVDIRMHRVKVDGEIYYNFRDSHIYECAAYQLSRMLEIDNVPPCIPRQIGDQEGTLQLWIEEAITERERRELERQPLRPMHWAREKQTLRLFDALIANIDRNQGNMLIDDRGKLWFIDHTRSFGLSLEISTLPKIVWCDRQLWKRLKALSLEDLERELSPFLTKDQMRSILKRRDQLRAHLEKRIGKLGESAVLFDLDSLQKVLADRDLAETDDDFPANTSLPDLGG